MNYQSDKEQLQAMVNAIERAYEELPKAIEQAYRDGYNDGYNDCHDSRPEPDSAWLKSGSKKSLAVKIGDGVKV